MFRLARHRAVLRILEQLDARFLLESGAYFGGGTLITLMLGEYRLSHDIDFVCSIHSGYRTLRNAIADRGYQALFLRRDGIALPREPRTDQYGIRFPVETEDGLIKFEMIAEGRILLDSPQQPAWCPVACLSTIDAFAEKLLANADRWADGSVASRDLIDLCFMRLTSPIPDASISKAENAYSVLPSLKKAMTRFQEQPEVRERCFTVLGITNRSAAIDGLDLLAMDLQMPTTERISSEIPD